MLKVWNKCRGSKWNSNPTTKNEGCDIPWISMDIDGSKTDKNRLPPWWSDLPCKWRPLELDWHHLWSMLLWSIDLDQVDLLKTRSEEASEDPLFDKWNKWHCPYLPIISGLQAALLLVFQVPCSTSPAYRPGHSSSTSLVRKVGWNWYPARTLTASTATWSRWWRHHRFSCTSDGDWSLEHHWRQ